MRLSLVSQCPDRSTRMKQPQTKSLRSPPPCTPPAQSPRPSEPSPRLRRWGTRHGIRSIRGCLLIKHRSNCTSDRSSTPISSFVLRLHTYPRRRRRPACSRPPHGTSSWGLPLLAIERDWLCRVWVKRREKENGGRHVVRASHMYQAFVEARLFACSPKYNNI